jgi:hypothetical protein
MWVSRVEFSSAFLFLPATALLTALFRRTERVAVEVGSD